MDTADIARENTFLKARLAEVEATLAESQEANRRLEEILRTAQREKFGKRSEKRLICAQARDPCILVAQIARRYAMNTNLMHQWLRDPRFAQSAPFLSALKRFFLSNIPQRQIGDNFQMDPQEKQLSNLIGHPII